MDDDVKSADGGEAPQVYTLTRLVRGAGATRRVVIASFDVPLRGTVITACALVASIPPTVLAWAVAGEVAVILPIVFVAAVFYLVEARSRLGLRLRNYQQMVDKRRAAIGEFICYGKPVDPAPRGWGRIIPSSMPSPYLKPAADPSAYVHTPAIDTGHDACPVDESRTVPTAREVDRAVWG